MEFETDSDAKRVKEERYAMQNRVLEIAREAQQEKACARNAKLPDAEVRRKIRKALTDREKYENRGNQLYRLIKFRMTYPELEAPDPGEDGRIKCQYCYSTYKTADCYINHIRQGVACMRIRETLGIPIRHAKEYRCPVCDKMYRTKHTLMHHEVKCRAKGLKVIPFDISDPLPEPAGTLVVRNLNGEPVSSVDSDTLGPVVANPMTGVRIRHID